MSVLLRASFEGLRSDFKAATFDVEDLEGSTNDGCIAAPDGCSIFFNLIACFCVFRGASSNCLFETFDVTVLAVKDKDSSTTFEGLSTTGAFLSLNVLIPDVPGKANEAPGEASNIYSKYFGTAQAGVVLCTDLAISEESNDGRRTSFKIGGVVFDLLGAIFDGPGNEQGASSVAVAVCALYFGIR